MSAATAAEAASSRAAVSPCTGSASSTRCTSARRTQLCFPSRRYGIACRWHQSRPARAELLPSTRASAAVVIMPTAAAGCESSAGTGAGRVRPEGAVDGVTCGRGSSMLTTPSPRGVPAARALYACHRVHVFHHRHPHRHPRRRSISTAVRGRASAAEIGRSPNDGAHSRVAAASCRGHRTARPPSAWGPEASDGPVRSTPRQSAPSCQARSRGRPPAPPSR